jgi:hypothetical protein
MNVFAAEDGGTPVVASGGRGALAHGDVFAT